MSTPAGAGAADEPEATPATDPDTVLDEVHTEAPVEVRTEAEDEAQVTAADGPGPGADEPTDTIDDALETETDGGDGGQVPQVDATDAVDPAHSPDAPAQTADIDPAASADDQPPATAEPVGEDPVESDGVEGAGEHAGAAKDPADDGEDGSRSSVQTEDQGHPPGRHVAPVAQPGGFSALRRAFGPRTSRSQVVVGILCALLGFALVVQVSQTQEDQLSSLRQSDLVRLLDDVTQRSEELEGQVSDLQATRDELRSGSGRQRAALEVAQEQAQVQGILSGRSPAQGPGVEIDIVEGDQQLTAFSMFNVLEELRNAGAEVMEVNGVRLVTQSYFEDTEDGIVVDGKTIASPYRWTAIGDPSTVETALEIPGGAMAALRSDGARTTITQRDTVEITATTEPAEPEFATPVPPQTKSDDD